MYRRALGVIWQGPPTKTHLTRASRRRSKPGASRPARRVRYSWGGALMLCRISSVHVSPSTRRHLATTPGVGAPRPCVEEGWAPRSGWPKATQRRGPARRVRYLWGALMLCRISSLRVLPSTRRHLATTPGVGAPNPCVEEGWAPRSGWPKAIPEARGVAGRRDVCGIYGAVH